RGALSVRVRALPRRGVFGRGRRSAAGATGGTGRIGLPAGRGARSAEGLGTEGLPAAGADGARVAVVCAGRAGDRAAGRGATGGCARTDGHGLSALLPPTDDGDGALFQHLPRGPAGGDDR